MLKVPALALLLLLPAMSFGQANTDKSNQFKQVSATAANVRPAATYTSETHQLTYQGAMELLTRARAKAATMQKEVSVAVVDASGELILLSPGDGVGPHNTEAARRKAFTALSTKTTTLTLGRKAKLNPDTENLAHLPELLLLGGGVPVWYKGRVIGGIGVAGGGGPEQDDLIAKAAGISEAEITLR